MKGKIQLTILALFVSHRSGEHNITLHPNKRHLKKELKSLMEVIHEDKDEEHHKEAVLEDRDAVNELRSYHEFADTTWYHYQEIPYGATIDLKKIAKKKAKRVTASKKSA